MAYVFNGINNALGQNKQNIFDPTQQGGQEQAQGFGSGSQRPASGGSSGPSASSGGASSGGASQSRQPAQANASTQSYNPQQAQRAYNAIAPIDTSKETGKIRTDLQSANQTLQDKANAYTQGAQQTAQGYQVSDETLNKAADGDDAAYQDVANRLSGQRPDQYDAFEGLTDKEVPSSADPLAHKSLWGEIFREPLNNAYTAGESRMNSMLLRGNRNFVNEAAKLQGAQDALYGKSDDMVSDLTDSTRDMLSTAYSDATTSAKSKLQGLADSIMSGLYDKETAGDAERQNQDQSAILSQLFGDLASSIKGDNAIASSDNAIKRSLKYLDDPSKFDISKYLNLDTDTDWNEYVDQNTADRFNRINALLGSDKNLTASATGTGDPYAFDESGAKQWVVSELQRLRGLEDEGLQEQFTAAEMAARNKQAQSLSALNSYMGTGVLGSNAANYADSINAAKQYLENSLFAGKNLTAGQKATMNNAIKNALINQYKNNLSSFGATSSWDSRLSQADAYALNDLSKQLGIMSNYAAYNPKFNAQSLMAAYQSEYNKLLQAAAPPAAPTPIGGGKNNGERPLDYLDNGMGGIR